MTDLIVGCYDLFLISETQFLSFTYLLPLFISEKIDNGLYTLFVQKQAGLPEMGLTLRLNFGNNRVIDIKEDLITEYFLNKN